MCSVSIGKAANVQAVIHPSLLDRPSRPMLSVVRCPAPFCRCRQSIKKESISHFPELVNWCCEHYDFDKREVVSRNGIVVLTLTPEAFERMLLFPNRAEMSPLNFDTLSDIFLGVSPELKDGLFKMHLKQGTPIHTS